MPTFIGSDLRSTDCLYLTIRLPVCVTAMASSTAASTSAVSAISSAVALIEPFAPLRVNVTLFIELTYESTADFASSNVILLTSTLPIYTPSAITSSALESALILYPPTNIASPTAVIPALNKYFLYFLINSSYPLSVSEYILPL